MSYFLRHVAVSRKDGTLHAVRLTGVELVFRSQGLADAVLTLAEPAVQCRIAVDGQGVRWCVTSAHRPGGPVMLVSPDGPKPQQITLGAGAGWAHLRALENGCEVYVMERGAVSVYQETGQIDRIVPMVQASEGIHHIAADGRPVSEDEARGPRMIGGELLWRIDEHDGCALGQVSDPDGLAFFDGATLHQFDPPIQTQQSSYFAVNPHTGDRWFAIPGHDTPEPDECHLVPRVKPAPAPQPAPVVVPPTPVEPPQPTNPPVAEMPVPPPSPPPAPSTPTPAAKVPWWRKVLGYLAAHPETIQVAADIVKKTQADKNKAA